MNPHHDTPRPQLESTSERRPTDERVSDSDSQSDSNENTTLTENPTETESAETTGDDAQSLERLETTSIESDGETRALPPARDPTGELETYIAASYIEKGGVGKTTTVAHLARTYAEAGFDVVAVGLAGKQTDLSQHFGIEYPSEDPDQQPNIATAFKDERQSFAELMGGPEAFVEELVYKTAEGVDVIPSHQQLDGLETILNAEYAEHTDRYSRLEPFVTEYLAPLYDIVLFDLPGAPTAVAYNVLWAAENVIVPARPGRFEETQIGQIRTDIADLNALGRSVQIATIIPSMVEIATNRGPQFVATLLDEHAEHVSPAFVPKSAAVSNAQYEARTVFTDDEPSSTAAKARAAYRLIAIDLLARIEAHQRDVDADTDADANADADSAVEASGDRR